MRNSLVTTILVLWWDYWKKPHAWVSKYQPTSLYKLHLYTAVLPGCCSSLLKPMRGPLPSTLVTSIDRISPFGVSILDLTLWWRSRLLSVQKHLSRAQICQASVIPSISMFDKSSGSQTVGQVSETQRNQSKRCAGPDGCKKKTSSLALQQPANTLSNRAISPPASGPPSSTGCQLLQLCEMGHTNTLMIPSPCFWDGRHNWCLSDSTTTTTIWLDRKNPSHFWFSAFCLITVWLQYRCSFREFHSSCFQLSADPPPTLAGIQSERNADQKSVFKESFSEWTLMQQTWDAYQPSHIPPKSSSISLKLIIQMRSSTRQPFLPLL